LPYHPKRASTITAIAVVVTTMTTYLCASGRLCDHVFIKRTVVVVDRYRFAFGINNLVEQMRDDVGSFFKIEEAHRKLHEELWGDRVRVLHEFMFAA
jgi:hypothetical protein